MEEEHELAEDIRISVEDISVWSYLATLEFLDGPRKDTLDKSGKGLYFSRKVGEDGARKLAEIAPSKEQQEEKQAERRKNVREQVEQLSGRELAEERKHEEEEEKKIELEMEEKRKELEEKHGQIQKETLWEALVRERKKTVPILRTPQDGKKWRRKRFPQPSKSSPELEDLSDQMFYYARNSGASTRRIAFAHERMMRRFNKPKMGDPFSMMTQDIGFPFNRLRIRLNAGQAALRGDALYDYENEIRVHAGLLGGSLFFMPLYFDEEAFGSFREGGMPRERTARPEPPTPGVRLNLERVRNRLFGTRKDSSVRLVPLMTLQTCVLLQNFFQAVQPSNFPATAGAPIATEEEKILQALDLVIGGDIVQEILDATTSEGGDSTAKAKVFHAASAQLIFVPVFTGRKITLPDLSDALTVNRFVEIYDSLGKKSPSFARMVSTLRRSLDTKENPFEEQRASIEFLSVMPVDSILTFPFGAATLFGLASPGDEVKTLLVHGLGYDGFLVHNPPLGTIAMVDVMALEDSLAFDIHLRHIDFGLRRGVSETKVRMVTEKLGFEIFHRESHFRGQEHRLFLFFNEKPTEALFSVRIEEDTLEQLLEKNAGTGKHIPNAEIHFTFLEGQTGRGKETPKEKNAFFLVKRGVARTALYKNAALVPFSNAFAERTELTYPVSLDYYPEVHQRKENKEFSLRSKLEEVLPSASATEPKKKYVLKVKAGHTGRYTLPHTIETPNASIFRMVVRELLYRAYYTKITIGRGDTDEVHYPPLIAIDNRFASTEGKKGTQPEGNSAIYTPVDFARLSKHMMPSILSKRIGQEAVKTREGRMRKMTTWFHRMGLEVSNTYVDNFSSMMDTIRSFSSMTNGQRDYDFLRFACTMSPMSAQASLLNLWFSYAVKLDRIGSAFRPIGLQDRGGAVWGVLSSMTPIYSDSMGDLGEQFETTRENFPTDAIVDRFYGKEFVRKEKSSADARKIHLGLLDDTIASYAQEYRKIMQSHWEMAEDITHGQMSMAELYWLSPLRMWHLNEIAQLSRMAIAVITYFSFRRHALFGNYFAMYAPSTGVVSGGVSEPGLHFSKVSASDVRGHYEDLRNKYRRRTYSIDERTSEELDLISRFDHTMSWVDTIDHKQRLYALGAFKTSTLPSWKATLEFSDERMWVHEEAGKRVPVNQQIVLDMNPEDARIAFPSWWDQSFSRVRFADDFILEGFDPSEWSNYIAHSVLEGLRARIPAEEGTSGEDDPKQGGAHLAEEQVNLLQEWMCRRNTVEHDPLLRIRHTGDHLKGNGLFCDDPRGIPPGSFIMPFDGLIVSHSQLYGAEEKRVDRKHYSPDDIAFYGNDRITGEPLYIAPASISIPPRAVHHRTPAEEEGTEEEEETEKPAIKPHLVRFSNGAVSKNIANCAIVNWIVNGEQQAWLVNVYTRTIQPGEELMWTYDLSGINFFKEIGLYSRSAGFIYPPDRLYDYRGKERLVIENDRPSKVLHDAGMRFIDGRPEKISAREIVEARGGEEEGEEEVIEIAQTEVKRLQAYRLEHEERFKRFNLIHSLYSGVAIPTDESRNEGKVDVPLLDYYKSEEHHRALQTAVTTDGRERERTRPEWHQPLRYVSYASRQAWTIRTETKQDRVKYYGVPVPREVPALVFIAPAFKRLASLYGVSAIVDLVPKLEVDNYANTPHAVYDDDARGKISDTAMSLEVKRNSIIQDSWEMIQTISEITSAFFGSRRQAQYGKMDVFLQGFGNIAQMERALEQTKDMSLVSSTAFFTGRTRSGATGFPPGTVQEEGAAIEVEEETGPAIREGSTRYIELTHSMNYSNAARETIQEEWSKNAGYHIYVNAHMVLSHYDNVYSNTDETNYLQRTRAEEAKDSTAKPENTVAKSARVYIENYESTRSTKKAVVRYTGDASRGLGLYAKEDIVPGEPILPFLGELVTQNEFDTRLIQYLNDHKELYDAYKAQIPISVRKELADRAEEGIETPDEETLEEIERGVRKNVGILFAETHGLDHPDPLYYAADFLKLGGVQLKIDPRLQGNDARIANTSRFYNNCTLQFILVLNQDAATRDAEPYKLVPWLVNTYSKMIHAGEEILWDYAQHEIDSVNLDYERAPWTVDIETHKINIFDTVPVDVQEPELREIKDYSPRIPVEHFAPQKDSGWTTETGFFFSQTKKDALEEEKVFPYGKETIHEEWTQYTMVMKPTSLEGYNEYAGTFPASGLELVRSMLGVTSNFVPKGMSPLAAEGDIIHQGVTDPIALWRVQEFLRETKVTSDAVTAAWCNVTSLFHGLPFRHFDSTPIRNAWLSVRDGGQRVKREHSMAQEVVSEPKRRHPTEAIRRELREKRRILVMLIAYANLAMDHLQKRLFSVLPKIAADPKQGGTFVKKVLHVDILPSQAQRNLLFLWMASWRTTSALFTNDRENRPIQIKRVQALLRALGFTSLLFSTKVRVIQKETETIVSNHHILSTEHGARIGESTVDPTRVAFYTHALDPVFQDILETGGIPAETLLREGEVPSLAEISETGSIPRAQPPSPVRGEREVPLDRKEIRLRLTYPIVTRLGNPQMVVESMEDIVHLIRAKPSESFIDPLPDDEYKLDMGADRLQAMIRAVNQNLQLNKIHRDYIPGALYGEITADFPQARTYIEAHYDAIIWHNLERLNVLFHLMKNGLNTFNSHWTALENKELRVTMHGIRAIEILSREIQTYADFQEWKRPKGPYFYYPSQSIRILIPNQDFIHAEDDATFGRGPSAYYLLGTYGAMMYEDSFNTYESILRWGNEREEGPVVFRTDFSAKNISIGHPWWAQETEEEEPPMEPLESPPRAPPPPKQKARAKPRRRIPLLPPPEEVVTGTMVRGEEEEKESVMGEIEVVIRDIWKVTNSMAEAGEPEKRYATTTRLLSLMHEEKIAPVEKGVPVVSNNPFDAADRFRQGVPTISDIATLQQDEQDPHLPAEKKVVAQWDLFWDGLYRWIQRSMTHVTHRDTLRAVETLKEFLREARGDRPVTKRKQPLAPKGVVTLLLDTW